MTHQAIGLDDVERGLRRAQRFRFLRGAPLRDTAEREDQNQQDGQRRDMRTFHLMIPPFKFNCRESKNASASGFESGVTSSYWVAPVAIALNKNGNVAMLWPRYCGRNANITMRPLPRFTSTIAALFASFSPPSSHPDNSNSFASAKRAITRASGEVVSNASEPSTQATLSSRDDSSSGAPRVIGLVVSSLILRIETGQ